MSSRNPEPGSAEIQRTPAQNPAAQPTAPRSADARRPGFGHWLVFLGFGIVGGFAGWLLLERAHEYFAPETPKEVAGTQGILTPEQRALVRAAQVRADYTNVPLAIALLGLAVSGVLGLAPGFTAGSLRKSATGLAMGLTAGAVLGALGGAASVLVREQLRNWNTLAATGEPDPLLTQLHTMALHLPSWIAVALATGLAIAIAARARHTLGRTAGLAVVAVVVASLLYPVLASILFQMEDPGQVVPTGSANRLLWTMLNAGLIGLVVGRPANTPAPK